ncbi:MAG: hypothetical protein L6R35_002288 [Caloplaca aegaea]|nr:MAG: hypothetical protein L6R35_002288 [Caloplaca aegaea]
MRLFLLPISTRSSLIYCQRVNNQLSSKTTFADKITTRVSGVWLKWEKAEKGWQKKVTSYGNRLFQTIPHEEWGLKSIPPISKRRSEEELLGKEHVDLVFPASVINEREVTEALRRYAGDERQAFHTRWMWGAIAGMPIAAPDTKSSVLLPGLSRLVTLESLDASLKKIDQEAERIRERPSDNNTSDIEPDVKAERMLLTSSSGRLVADMVDVPELEEHIHRAVKQVEKSLKAKEEWNDEKRELDNANKEGGKRR